MKGVTGGFSGGDAIKNTVNSLYRAQHSGQEGSGSSAGSDIPIRTWNGRRLLAHHEVLCDTLNDIAEAIGFPDNHVCTYCISGSPPSKLSR